VTEQQRRRRRQTEPFAHRLDNVIPRRLDRHTVRGSHRMNPVVVAGPDHLVHHASTTTITSTTSSVAVAVVVEGHRCLFLVLNCQFAPRIGRARHAHYVGGGQGVPPTHPTIRWTLACTACATTARADTLKARAPAHSSKSCSKGCGATPVRPYGQVECWARRFLVKAMSRAGLPQPRPQSAGYLARDGSRSLSCCILVALKPGSSPILFLAY